MSSLPKDLVFSFEQSQILILQQVPDNVLPPNTRKFEFYHLAGGGQEAKDHVRNGQEAHTGATKA